MLLDLDRQVIHGDEVERIGHGSAEAATVAPRPGSAAPNVKGGATRPDSRSQPEAKPELSVRAPVGIETCK